jgi:hypothetical protein
MNLSTFRDTWQIWLVLLLIGLVVIGGALWAQWRLEPPADPSATPPSQAGGTNR